MDRLLMIISAIHWTEWVTLAAFLAATIHAFTLPYELLAKRRPVLLKYSTGILIVCVCLLLYLSYLTLSRRPQLADYYDLALLIGIVLCSALITRACEWRRNYKRSINTKSVKEDL